MPKKSPTTPAVLAWLKKHGTKKVRDSMALNAAATAVSRRLADATAVTARWIGRDALRQLASPAGRKRLAARSRRQTQQR